VGHIVNLLKGDFKYYQVKINRKSIWLLPAVLAAMTGCAADDAQDRAILADMPLRYLQAERTVEFPGRGVSIFLILNLQGATRLTSSIIHFQASDLMIVRFACLIQENNMKKLTFIVAAVLSFWITIPMALAGWQDFLKDLQSTISNDKGLTNGEIVDGLKQALSVGTQNAVTYVSKTDGYFGNPQIKIPLPEKVQKAGNLLRTIGFGKEVDDFELSMNRAAEKAAPEAVDIFKSAITRMSFSDARQILDGPDDAATTYFKGATFGKLQERFQPIVQKAMAEVGVTRQFQNMNRKLATIPFADQLSFDLDQYTTDKGLDGLFYMLAREEKKIRENPTARVTDLLKKVFSKN
jgi:hypothetical protein